MIIRCAFFEGHIRPGHEADFHEFVSRNLIPLWTQFPGAEEVRVLSQSASDTDHPHYAMVLAIRYPDHAALEKAMASEARQKSREVTGELIKTFDGRIFHTVFDLRHDLRLDSGSP